MNVANVLTPVNVEGTKTDSAAGKEGKGIDQNNLLFALFMQKLNPSNKADKQILGELAEAGPDSDSGEVTISDGTVSELSTYLQILQNLFPAGMEATSGSNGDQNSSLVSGLALKGNDAAWMMLGQALQEVLSSGAGQADKTMTNGEGLHLGNYLQAFGLKGISGSTADSLDPAELDDILGYLKELSGKIVSQKDKNYQATEPSDTNAKLLNWLSDKLSLIQDKNRADNSTATAQNITTQNTTTQNTLSGVAAAEDSAKNKQNLSSSGNNSQNDSMDSSIDPNQILVSGDKTDVVLTSSATGVSSVKAGLVNPGAVWDQVLGILNKQDLNSQEIKEISIQLQPQDLGKLNVSMKLENGQLHLIINASEQATGSLLQNNLQDLRNGLAQIGVSCGTLEMGYRQNDQQSSQDRNDYRSQQETALTLQEEASSILPVFTSYLTTNNQGNRINVSV
ncbi:MULTISPECIES: flagellar hook-length control protein FliK [unclassified Dehalobacter]|uniref:flagellar hook-length control protein FliK n=1 Tax=unclassified Dehalobacter TaxID=2635733 RepID=UPI0003615872|nr:MULTISPECIES: flagellar hook-length control protein FliK [unclassified Dehalobacter]RJE48745.1 flagellar hook-length control protein [Dehalobacter sp. MCB1]TCX51837.1 flagellar hook-length control protein FliK [Dehalobacter sp. 14DCB1]TCX52897.1 flagellar hook-length control protein FliK [Dehalobacter sp. 12DCB1]